MENEEKSQKDQKTKEQSIWKEIWDYAKIILIVFVIAYLLGHFVYINARIPSGSMEQTIMTGDRVFGNRLAYKTKDPERFDIVIFEYPDDPSQLFVKRVIGLPGETIQIHDGKVYINGSVLEDDVSEDDILTAGLAAVELTLGENEYFVLGDNRNNSEDSRFAEVKKVKKKYIEGKLWFRVAPVNKMGFVKH